MAREATRVPTEEFLRGVAWGDGRFVAVGDEGTIVQSRDGDRWEPSSSSATSERLDHVTWGNGRFVAVGEDEGTIVHSTDGEEATDSGQDDLLPTLHAVAWNGDRYVAVGEAAILHSGDGERWGAGPRHRHRRWSPRRRVER